MTSNQVRNKSGSSYLNETNSFWILVNQEALYQVENEKLLENRLKYVMLVNILKSKSK